MPDFRITWSDISRARPDWTPSDCHEFMISYRRWLDDAVLEGIKLTIDKFISNQEEDQRFEEE